MACLPKSGRDHSRALNARYGNLPGSELVLHLPYSMAPNTHWHANRTKARVPDSRGWPTGGRMRSEQPSTQRLAGALAKRVLGDADKEGTVSGSSHRFFPHSCTIRTSVVAAGKRDYLILTRTSVGASQSHLSGSAHIHDA